MADLKQAIIDAHDELAAFVKDVNEELDTLTIISIGDDPAGQMVIAPPSWPDEKVIARLQACIDGIKSGDMKQNA